MNENQDELEIMEKAVLELLNTRGKGKSICPSEVARAVGGNCWRCLMDSVRTAAVRLALTDRIEITQRGEVVSPYDYRGPIRFRLKIGPEPPRNGL